MTARDELPSVCSGPAFDMSRGRKTECCSNPPASSHIKAGALSSDAPTVAEPDAPPYHTGGRPNRLYLRCYLLKSYTCFILPPDSPSVSDIASACADRLWLPLASTSKKKTSLPPSCFIISEESPPIRFWAVWWRL